VANGHGVGGEKSDKPDKVIQYVGAKVTGKF
jgi:hypothetical protein